MSRYSVIVVDTSNGKFVKLEGDFHFLAGEYPPREGEYITIKSIEYKVGRVHHDISTWNGETLHMITIEVWTPLTNIGPAAIKPEV